MKHHDTIPIFRNVLLRNPSKLEVYFWVYQLPHEKMDGKHTLKFRWIFPWLNQSIDETIACWPVVAWVADPS